MITGQQELTDADVVMHESCVRIGRSIPEVIAAYHEVCSLLSPPVPPRCREQVDSDRKSERNRRSIRAAVRLCAEYLFSRVWSNRVPAVPDELSSSFEPTVHISLKRTKISTVV